MSIISSLTPTPTLSPSDFNNLITSLMASYNSQTTAHAAYLIAIAVGVLGIFYQGRVNDLFSSKLWKKILVLYLPLSIVFGLGIFIILRIIFWSWMGSEVLTVSNNITVTNGSTTIYAIQQSLTGKLVNNTPGWSSLFYYVDGKIFGLSLLILIFVVVFPLIIGLDFAYFHKINSTLIKRDKWENFYKVLVIVIFTIAIFAFIPSLTTPPIQHLINPNFNQTKGILEIWLGISGARTLETWFDIAIGLFLTVLIIGYFVIVGNGHFQKARIIKGINSFRSALKIQRFDIVLEKDIFSPSDSDLLPKTRYLQAYVKYLRIAELAKDYNYHLGNSGRIRDLAKDCLNDMEMALELKFGKRSEGNKYWEPWMHELADVRNHAIHRMTAFKSAKTIGAGKDSETQYYLRAESLKGMVTETSEEVLPYLRKTLGLIKDKLSIIEM